MFTRDIVVFDIESTGLDFMTHEVIQIAAVRLDKRTLSEMTRFVTYVKPQHWEARDLEAMAVNKISYDVVAIAPGIQKALELFEAKFPPSEVLLAAYNSWFDMGWLRNSYERMGRHSPFEFHSFDLWALAYLYWSKESRVANPNRPIGFNLADMAALLGVETAGQFHDAQTDVEVEAEVLRRLAGKFQLLD